MMESQMPAVINPIKSYIHACVWVAACMVGVSFSAPAGGPDAYSLKASGIATYIFSLKNSTGQAVAGIAVRQPQLNQVIYFSVTKYVHMCYKPKVFPQVNVLCLMTKVVE